jgi:transcriptional regulator with XRE-family HTH domain
MSIYAGIIDTMSTTRSIVQRRAFGDFVRSYRARVSPAAVGLPAGNRRRTPGLRREELAQLCGLSTTWFTWIEQGRDISVSSGALSRLSRVLQLGRAERAYLFDLAGKRDPDQGQDQPDVMSSAIVACVEAIDAPAYVLDRSWTARSFNKKAQRLFAGWLDTPDERNLLRFVFLNPAARSLICHWEERARRLVAEFRAASSAHFDEPAQRALVASLQQESRDFARFWDEQAVLGREGGERTFNHPLDGFLRYEQVTFNVANQPDLKLTMLVQAANAASIPANSR